MITSNL